MLYYIDMRKNIKSHMRINRLSQLPEALREELIQARRKRGWSQAKLGQKIGLPQMHISGIETGKIVPRYDTLLEVVRILGLDLVTVPRSLVPAVLALVRDYRRRDIKTGSEENELQSNTTSDIERPKGDRHNEV
jgi:transcriptional regulator with XRE-family HTH domain